LCILYAIPRAWLDAEPLVFTSDAEALKLHRDGNLKDDDFMRWIILDRPQAKRNETVPGAADLAHGE
jgi:hypothetical protein